MTIRNCPDCQSVMREYQHTDTCPRCGKSIPKLEFNFFQGRTSRVSLYPNRSAKPITKQFMDGFLRLFIYFMVMVSVLLILAYSMDATIWGVI